MVGEEAGFFVGEIFDDGEGGCVIVIVEFVSKDGVGVDSDSCEVLLLVPKK